jgi:amidase
MSVVAGGRVDGTQGYRYYTPKRSFCFLRSSRAEQTFLAASVLLQGSLFPIDTSSLVLLKEASEADHAARKGWLHGIPIAVKDLSNAEGFPTTMGGSPLVQDESPAKESDPFVQRLTDAGAIIIGKTNSPESGLGSHTYNQQWGTTVNPYNTQLSAGGSSGGAAVAVASKMLALADGSDMMGSLRNPAGWNHLYSIRPTAGILEYDPHPRNPLDYPISTVGPMARNVQDLTAFLTTMVGKSKYTCSSSSDEKFRIAWLGDWNGAYPMEKGIIDLCRQALAQSSTQVEDHQGEAIFPAHDLWKSWITIRSAVISHNELETHGKEALLGESSPVRDELKWEVRRGLKVTDDELDDARQIAQKWSLVVENYMLLNNYDAIALPSAQVWPFPKQWSRPESIGDVVMDTYHRWMEVVVPASLAGLPVVTVPAGFSEKGLPMGIQLIGRIHEENRLLQLGQRFNELSTGMEGDD